MRKVIMSKTVAETIFRLLLPTRRSCNMGSTPIYWVTLDCAGINYFNKICWGILPTKHH